MHPLKKKSHFLTQSKFENCEKSEFAIFTDALFLLVISTYSCLVCTRSAGGVTLYRTETNTVVTDTTETDTAELSLDGDCYIHFLNQDLDPKLAHLNSMASVSELPYMR